jgi:acyl carrier protein
MKEKFLTVIKDALEIQDRDLQWEDYFKEYEEWNSLNRLSVIVALDEEYGITISDKVLDSTHTLADLWAVVGKNGINHL